MGDAREMSARSRAPLHVRRSVTAAAFGGALVLPFAGSAVAAVPVCACGGGGTPEADPPAPDPVGPEATTEAQPVPEHQAPPPPDPKPGEHQALRPTPEPAPEPAPVASAAEPAPPPDPPEPSPYAGMSANAAEHWAESESAAPRPTPTPPEPEAAPAASPPQPPPEPPEPQPAPVASPPDPAPPADSPEPSPYAGMSADAAEHWAESESAAAEPAPEPPEPELAPVVAPPADSPEPSPYAGMSADAAEHWAESESSGADPSPESPYEGMSADAAEQWAASEEEQEAAPPQVSGEVMTWNLGRGASWKHGRGTDPNEVDEVAERIAEEEPDVVALQEVYTDFDIPATGEGDDVARLQEILREDYGLEYHAADGPASGISDGKCELTDGFWLGRRVRCGNFGNAVLSLEPITSDENIHLPYDGDEGRTVMEVETTIDGAPVTIDNTHVTTDDESESGSTPQDRQIETVFDEAGNSTTPTILAGDFNAEPDEVHPDAERTGFEDLTDPEAGTACGGGDSPDSKIDYVLGSNGVSGAAQPIGACDPSDHAPVVVDVSIPAEPEGPEYVALGDSYSAGTGTQDAYGPCERTEHAYPSQVAAEGGYALDFQACGGATTQDVLDDQIDAVSEETAVVTVSVGGNDADFSSVVRACAEPMWWGTPNCDDQVRDAQELISEELPERLDEVYGEIDSRAPQAEVVVVGYPHLLGSEDCNAITFFSPEERRWLGASADLLDEVTRERAAAHGFEYVSGIATFAGHEVCADEEYLNGVSNPRSNSFHPNRAGHSAYAEAVLGEIED
jgi:endonuclease/exonuclease/phosphatase family metal-dependent hydrolase/lysophospholipase L1-like esterase